MEIASRPWNWLARVAIVVALLVAGFLTLRGLGFWAPIEPGRVRPVPEGDQEIAWIAPATSGETWERLVRAVRLLARQWPQAHGSGELELETDRAFLLLTADVPEVGIRFPGTGTLWVRWYKLSGDNNQAHWVRSLSRRLTPPLAIVGGDTSDRARALAEILEQAKSSWPGPAPLFLITTATAERYLPANKPELELDHERWPRLMTIYPGRCFRFAFTNTRMVESVLEFLQRHPEVWSRQAAKEDSMRPPFFLFTLTWLDDAYSKDLAQAFQSLYARDLRSRFGKDQVIPFDEDFIHYGVGDYYQPNPREEMAVGLFLANNARRGDQRQLLVLPTGTGRARRFLRTLCRRAPAEMRDLVVANGDSISFNSIYRDRDLAWNVQDLPVPLVFFSHRNPIDAVAGFGVREPGNNHVTLTSTQDLLLFRDLIEAVVLAGFVDGKLLANADELKDRLRTLVWLNEHLENCRPGVAVEGTLPFFDDEGNRVAGTGEHVVWLRPVFEGTRVLPEASITVWRSAGASNVAGWIRVGEPLSVYYDRSADAGGGHADR